MSGKIIAITGGPRTGKSTLVKLLSEKMGGKSFLEGEEKIFLHEFLKILNLATGILNLYCGLEIKAFKIISRR